MPIIQITLAEGRTAEQKKAVAEKVTDVLVQELNVSPDSITVFLYELSKDRIARGGVLLSEQS
jgi:4-oxalocrotonate tautomerase